MLKQKVVLLLAVAVTAAVLLVFVHEYSKLRTFTRMGDMWSLVHLRNEMPSIFTEVDTLDFPEPPYPAPFDTLLSVNGLPATLSDYFTVFNPQRAVGDTIPITFSHGGEVLTTSIVTRSTPMGYRLLTQASFALRVLIAFGYFAIAYIGLLKRKPSSTVRSLVMFSLVEYGTSAMGMKSAKSQIRATCPARPGRAPIRTMRTWRRSTGSDSRRDERNRSASDRRQ